MNACGWALWEDVDLERFDLERGEIPLCGQPAVVRVIVSAEEVPALTNGQAEGHVAAWGNMRAHTYLCAEHRGKISGREEPLD